MPIPQITCVGTPYEIGFQHGNKAATLVQGSIRFYAELFESYTGKNWNQVTRLSEAFGKTIHSKWPNYYEEMRGIAEGVGCPVIDIIALNARTEIAFGLMEPGRVVTDGCTSLSWITDQSKRIGQNWDWMEEQAKNLVLLEIRQALCPTIKMVTEAGIIGKIGLNSEGLAVCLNAVRCHGQDATKLPIHLALRMSLESKTISQAVENLEAIGAAGSGFILLAQRDETIGLEMTSRTMKRTERDSMGKIMHTNHLLLKHEDTTEWPEPDSFTRFDRLIHLTSEHHRSRGSGLTENEMLRFFDDHDQSPFSICRTQEGECKDATLFNIVVDLDKKSAVVKIGRPCQVEEEIHLDFL